MRIAWVKEDVLQRKRITALELKSCQRILRMGDTDDQTPSALLRDPHWPRFITVQEAGAEKSLTDPDIRSQCDFNPAPRV